MKKFEQINEDDSVCPRDWRDRTMPKLTIDEKINKVGDKFDKMFVYYNPKLDGNILYNTKFHQVEEIKSFYSTQIKQLLADELRELAESLPIIKTEDNDSRFYINYDENVGRNKVISEVKQLIENKIKEIK